MKTEATTARPPGPVRIVIVDDHALIRYGLKALLGCEAEFEVCGEAESAAAALPLLAETHPDLAICDISLKGGMDGIDLTQMALKAHPRLRVLVLSMHNEPGYARRALAAGARGYVNKGDASALLIEALRTILEGGIYLTPDMRHLLGRAGGQAAGGPVS